MIRLLSEEIIKLRGENNFLLNDAKIERYRICVRENDGTHTSYCTSVPLCKKGTNNVVELQFKASEKAYILEGSNAVVKVNDHIHMESDMGSCIISLPSQIVRKTESFIEYKNAYVFPTSNGIVCKARVNKNNPFLLTLTSKELFLNTRSNNKYFSLMRAKFRPLVTISSIGSLDYKDRFISPAFLSYIPLSNNSYQISISSENENTEFVIFEINMYDEKLLQDTTVESRSAGSNNAFGSVAFLGNTMAYGEQWLYSRADFTRIPELFDKKINGATVHYPRFDDNNIKLSAFKVSSRFCSFGSNWSNKIGYTYSVSDSIISPNYQSVDLTNLITDPYTGKLVYSEGWVLKTQVKVSDYTAITTGDSHFAPVVIEINHN